MNNSEVVKILMILGMHRSGTSCLTGSLQQKNIYLGNVHLTNPHNLKGNRENQLIVDLNDSILEFNNATWSTPPLCNIKWNDNHRNERLKIIQSMSDSAFAAGYEFWGFKDPRALLLLPFWQEGLSKTVYIGTFRHPISVAKSLIRRSSMPVHDAVMIWKYYNEQLLNLWKVHKFPLMCFDVPDSQYETDLNRAYRLLNLDNVNSDLSFFNSGLRKNSEVDLDFELPQDVLTLYDELFVNYQNQ